jgi:nucleoside-diphosphate-sugar epimerase
MKVIVTGGSGFIGTNMIDLLIQNNYDVLNYDIKKPRKKGHLGFWRNINICNKEQLLSSIKVDSPDYVIHLAARTDLKESECITGYDANISGVRNVMDCCGELNCLKRIIVASSMLVCKLGYLPHSFDDYMPNSLYGESKVLTEKIVKEYNLSWTIVRPTSIWGPWFGEPYKNFFYLVIKGLYFNIPEKNASNKTYGYVENTCYQIYKLMLSTDSSVNHNYFYLGDLQPLNISVWANKIRNLNKQSNPLTMPIWLLKLTAILGDLLKRFFGISNFPMTTFRFLNMTNNNIIHDLSRTIQITHYGKDSSLDHQILETLNWLNQNKQ